MSRWQCLVAVGLVSIVIGAPVTAMAASTITYTYDVFGQLITANSTAGRAVTYTYDAAGNRTNMSATGTIALNAPASETAVRSVDKNASVGISNPQAYADNQGAAVRRAAPGQGGSAARALR